MTFVPCPECGFDVPLKSLKDGEQRTLECQNCFTELMVYIENGEIHSEPVETESYSELHEFESDGEEE